MGQGHWDRAIRTGPLGLGFEDLKAQDWALRSPRAGGYVLSIRSIWFWFMDTYIFGFSQHLAMVYGCVHIYHNQMRVYNISCLHMCNEAWTVTHLIAHVQ